jgi:hypothetical protein
VEQSARLELEALSGSAKRLLGRPGDLGDALERSRATAQALVEKLKSDADFRDRVRKNPSLLEKEGLPEGLIYPFVEELDRGISPLGDSCGGSCLITHNVCAVTNDCGLTHVCVCTGDTVPW